MYQTERRDRPRVGGGSGCSSGKGTQRPSAGLGVDGSTEWGLGGAGVGAGDGSPMQSIKKSAIPLHVALWIVFPVVFWSTVVVAVL